VVEIPDPGDWFPDPPDTPDVSTPDISLADLVGGEERAKNLKKLAAPGTAVMLLDFARNPTEFILEQLLTFLITQVVLAASVVVEVVLAAGELVAEVPGLIAAPLLIAGRTALDSALTAITSITLALGPIVQNAGPFAPLVTVGFLVLTGMLTARLITAGAKLVSPL
jgi:hypothetical protein